MNSTALNLFDDIIVQAPKTEGIKYAGSKLKLLPHILTLISKVRPKTVFDGFSGSTRVSQALAKSGYQVISNDTAIWSETFATCYLLNKFPAEHFNPILEHLNNLRPRDGWFTEVYGGEGGGSSSIGKDGLKKPWQRHNTQMLDAIREEIDRLSLSDTERAVLLTSLILALDEVDSTLGHFASYLNKWSPRSYKTLHLRVPMLFPPSGLQHVVQREDTLTLTPKIEADLSYFDPPYGSNNDKMPPSRVRYAAYYHIWTTVCRNDRPSLFGKVGRRSDTSDTTSSSVFEEFRRGSNGRFIVVNSIDELLRKTKSQFILLSYSSGGRATAEELREVISQNAKLLEVLEFDYKKNVMSGMCWTNDWIRDTEKPHREFLFLMEKK